MKTLALVVALFVAGCSNQPTQQERTLSKELERNRKLIADAREAMLDAESDTKKVDAVRRRVESDVKEQASQIKSMQERIKAFELEEYKRKLDAESNEAHEKYRRGVMAIVQAPVIITSTNQVGGEDRTITFPKIFDKNEKRVTYEATYSSLIGRHITFSIPSGKRVAFDVDEIHPAVLVYLDIDPVLAKDRQTEIDLAQERYNEGYKKAGEIVYERELERRKIEAEMAERRAVREEESRKARFEEYVKDQYAIGARLNGEASMIRANAAQTAADASILNAGTPQNVNNIRINSP